MRKEIQGKLPLYKELKKLVLVQKLSYREIGHRYDTSESAVYATLRRRALAYGDPWPLQSNALIKAKTRQGNDEKIKEKFVNPILVRAEVIRYKEFHNLTYKELSVLTGVSASSLASLVKRQHKYLRRDIAIRIMKFIQANDFIEEEAS